MDQRLVDLYNVYIHGDMPRRDFLQRLAKGRYDANAAKLAWARTIALFDHRLKA